MDAQTTSNAVSSDTDVIVPAGVWTLVGRASPEHHVQAFEINRRPFRVGRRSEAELSLANSTVSGWHAEIIFGQDGPCIRDLASTNGTYVNGRPIREVEPIQPGDLIQFADAAFRLTLEVPTDESRTMLSATNTSATAMSLVQFDRLLADRAVTPHFQPILNLADRTIVGYEVLGRSRLHGLRTPKDMFLAASQLDLEAELSAMLRTAALEQGRAIPDSPNLFLNTHPTELVNCGLLDSLREIRSAFPQQPITLEVHEAAVTDPEMMRKLRSELENLNMQLAYDDFGAGQSRLVELMEVCPDVVKFDMHLIRDIDKAPPRQQQMLAHLVRMVRELDILSLAEGVETAGEDTMCREIGFQLGQGYYYGKPVAAAVAASNSESYQLV